VGRPAEGRAGMPWDAAFDDHLILAYPLPFRMRRARGYVSKMSASDINAGSASLRSLQRRRSPLSLQRFFFGQQRRMAVKARSRAGLKPEQRQTNPDGFA